MNKLHGAIAALITVCPKDKQALAIDMKDFAESVLGEPATNPTKLGDITRQTVNIADGLHKRSKMRVVEIQDALTDQEFCDIHGTWLLTEYEHPRYLLICVDRLSVDETLASLAD